MLTRRLWGLLALALLVAGCTTAPQDDSTSTTLPPAATLLRVASTDWPACLNPLTCDSEATRNLVLQHVLPKLFEVDATGGYVPSPVLADAPTSSVDPDTGQQTITYRIAPDARWHDGRPITSSDVRGTWQAYVRTGAPDPVDYGRIIEVDDTDPLVAVVRLSAPMADWRELFGGYGGWLLEADAFGASPDLNGMFDDELPFGAGPFTLVSFDQEAIVLAAAEDYWNPERAAGIDQVRVEHVPAGDPLPVGVDVVLPDVDVGDVPQDLIFESSTTTQLVGVFFDQRTPALAQQPVRAAVDAVVDRRSLLELVVGPADEPPAIVTCIGWLPGEPECDPADLVEVDDDPAAADALLNDAGWTRTDGADRTRGAETLTVPVTFDPALPGAESIGDAIRFRLRALGVVVQQSAVPVGEWLARGRQTSTGIGVFPVTLGTPGRAAALYRCTEEGPNPLGWCDPSIQDLVATLASAADPEVYGQAVSVLSEQMAALRAWLPLYQRTRSWLLASGRIERRDEGPLGGGPLGALWGFARTD